MYMRKPDRIFHVVSQKIGELTIFIGKDEFLDLEKNNSSTAEQKREFQTLGAAKDYR